MKIKEIPVKKECSKPPLFSLAEVAAVTQGEILKNVFLLPIKGVSCDTRLLNKGDLFIAIKGERFNGHDFLKKASALGASAILVEDYPTTKLQDEISAPLIKVKSTVRAFGELAKFHKNKFNIPIVAVTGSNGKTTTKEAISSVLNVKYRLIKNSGTENNHIGVPKTLFRLSNIHQLAVLEMGMNHLGEIDYLGGICEPAVGVLTNIAPAHLEYLENIENILKAKSELLKHLKKDSVLILNSDDTKLCGLMKKSPCKVITFGIRRPSQIRASRVSNKNNSLEFKVGKTNFSVGILGRHNIYNMLAAVAVGEVFGIGHNEIKKALSDFKLPSMRLNLKEVGGVVIIDDTYNSNPYSMKAALDALSSYKTCGKKIFVFSDMLELGKASKKFHDEVGKDIAKSGIDALIAIGDFSRYTVSSAKINGMKNAVYFKKKEEALNTLKGIAVPKDVLLFKGSRGMKVEEVMNCFITSYIR